MSFFPLSSHLNVHLQLVDRSIIDDRIDTFRSIRSLRNISQPCEKIDLNREKKTTLSLSRTVIFLFEKNRSNCRLNV